MISISFSPLRLRTGHTGLFAAVSAQDVSYRHRNHIIPIGFWLPFLDRMIPKQELFTEIQIPGRIITQTGTGNKAALKRRCFRAGIYACFGLIMSDVRHVFSEAVLCRGNSAAESLPAVYHNNGRVRLSFTGEAGSAFSCLSARKTYAANDDVNRMPCCEQKKTGNKPERSVPKH